MARKSGPLSKADKDFIFQNVDVMSAEDIADHLDRNPKSVRNHIQKNRLGKKFEAASSSEFTQNQLYTQLKDKPFFRQLQQQFSDDEILYFCEYWVLTVGDFGGNILSYEELELKEWLTFEILKGRELKQNKINIIRKQSLKEQLEDEFKKDKDERDMPYIKYLQGEIMAITEDIKRYNKEFSDLAYKADKIKQGLVKSRDQRTKDMDMAKLDWTSYLKMLQEYDVKKRVGNEMEIFKMSEDKKREELYEYREFADGEVDLPILNAESIERTK